MNPSLFLIDDDAATYSFSSAAWPTPNHWSEYLSNESSIRSQGVELLTSHYRLHKMMLQDSGASPSTAFPLSYVHLHKPLRTVLSGNSAAAMPAVALESYREMEEELSELLDSESVEEGGAARSALVVVDHLKRRLMAPPELAWQGDDAVVMLWALGTSTFALTITDGELGYVVRKNRKAIKMRDSIKLDAFRLEDLR